MHVLAVRCPRCRTVRPDQVVCRWLSARMVWICVCRHRRTMGARTRRVAYTDGKHEQCCWRHPFDHGRSLSMVSAQGHLLSALPRHPALSPIPWRLSPECLGRFEARSLARRSLCWMLLGVDDIVVRWRRDEHVMDGGYCDACARGESRQGASRVARSRRWPYRRRLVAHAAYVRCRAFADTCRGAHAVPWVDRGLGPRFFRPGHANVRFGSLADITYPKRVRL
jgi:hypothetical protein